jgi:hypothetical protein
VASQGSVSAFPPILENTDSCAAWYIADVDNFTTVGDTVISQWDDMSGSNNHLTQAVNANMPHYDADTVNISSLVEYAAASYTGDSIFIYMILRQNTWVSGNRIMVGGGANPRFNQYTSSPGLGLYGGTGYVGPNNDCVLNEWHVVRWFYAGSNSKIQVDAGTPSTGSPGSDGVGAFTIGHVTNASLVSILELVLMNTRYDESAIYNYLYSKIPE